MKPKKLSRKLGLNKVTITNLSNIQLNSIHGGIIISDTPKICTDVSIPETYCCTQGCETQGCETQGCETQGCNTLECTNATRPPCTCDISCYSYLHPVCPC
jgi:hypothetical protein